MLIVADENLPLLDEFWGGLGQIRRLEGRTMSASDVREADVLLVRSVTRVDEGLIADARPLFVGTATIGIDHVDLGFLAARKIPFASAPGCNAVAVAEYVTTVLALYATQSGLRTEQLRLGIIGCGQVGSRVCAKARALGIPSAVCDPFLSRGDILPDVLLMGLDPLLDWADVISLHVPLSRQGAAPTWHLLDEPRLSGGRWNLLINTARGAVVDNSALMRAIRSSPHRKVVLDVWEDEPGISAELVERVWLGTPHVAGYSIEGKWRGTAMLREAAGEVPGLGEGPKLDSVLRMRGDKSEPLEWQGCLSSTLAACCPLKRDDAELRRLASEARDVAEIARGFDRMRKRYPDRREFSHYVIRGAPCSEWRRLRDLGFGITD